jgi:hypothetical protein
MLTLIAKRGGSGAKYRARPNMVKGGVDHRRRATSKAMFGKSRLRSLMSDEALLPRPTAGDLSGPKLGSYLRSRTMGPGETSARVRLCNDILDICARFTYQDEDGTCVLFFWNESNHPGTFFANPKNDQLLISADCFSCHHRETCPLACLVCSHGGFSAAAVEDVEDSPLPRALGKPKIYPAGIFHLSDAVKIMPLLS